MEIELKKEIEKIHTRNKRVETDKAWEISFTRRGIIAVVTYFIVIYFLIIIDAPNPYLNACVPAIGYVLSTLTMPWVKEQWIKKIWKK